MRFLLTILLLLLFAWCGALVWFLHRMPEGGTPPTVTTDAIVVLTGGSGRVERGFAMLAQGAAPVLFISGVGREVTLPEMMREHADEETRLAIRDRGGIVILDHVASSTQTNAQEVAMFLRSRHLDSIRLITANYHMLRSKTEIASAMPGVRIVADPVSPASFRRTEWWRHEITRRLVLSEFHKYIAVQLRLLTDGNGSPA